VVASPGGLGQQPVGALLRLTDLNGHVQKDRSLELPSSLLLIRHWALVDFQHQW
jgi:hypothetical protein